MCICVFTNKTTFRTKQIHIRRCWRKKHSQRWKTEICKFVNFLCIHQQNHSLRPNLPADENLISLFSLFFLVSSYVGYVPASDDLDIFVLFSDVSFRRGFCSWLRINQLFVEKFLEAPDLPKHNKFWEIHKWFTKTFDWWLLLQYCWVCLI